MDIFHWIDLIIMLTASAALFGVLALTDRIGGRK